MNRPEPMSREDYTLFTTDADSHGARLQRKGFSPIYQTAYSHTWHNLDTLTLISYCEGDVTEMTFKSEADFLQEVEYVRQWAKENI